MANGGGLDLSDVLNSDGTACGTGTTTACDGIQSVHNYVPVADIDPIMKNYFLLFPAPNYSSPSGNYTSSPPESQNQVNFDARIDQHFGSNDVLFGRIAYNPITTIYPEGYPEITSANATQAQKAAGLIGIFPGSNGSSGFPGPSNTKSYNLQADYVHIFSPKLLMDLKTGFARVNIASLPYNYKDGAAQKMGYTADIDTGDEMPAMGGPGIAWNALLGSANQVPLVDINNTFQYAGSVTYTRGSHNIKAGAGLIRRQINAFQNTQGGGMFLFFANAAGNGPGFDSAPYTDARLNFITGYPGIETRENAVYKPGFRAREINGYLQDDWRASNKLTVNLGLRYDIFTPFTEAHGHYANFIPSCLSSGTIGANCFLTGNQNATVGVKTDYKDIAPRVGFAYSVNNATVLRAGFGLSFFPADVGESSISGSTHAELQPAVFV